MEERLPFSLTFPGGSIRFKPVYAASWRLSLVREGAEPHVMGVADSEYLRRRLLPWLLSPTFPLNDYGWLLSLHEGHHSLYAFDGNSGSVKLLIENDRGRQIEGFTLDAESLARWLGTIRVNLPGET